MNYTVFYRPLSPHSPGTGSRIPLLTNVSRIYRSTLRYDTNRTDVSTQESGRDEISPRAGINLLVEAVRVVAIIHAYTMGNSPAVA